jgi:hypothetical protein
MTMEKMDYWRLCDELSVVQAALLLIGVDPGDVPYIMNWEEHKRLNKRTKPSVNSDLRQGK